MLPSPTTTSSAKRSREDIAGPSAALAAASPSFALAAARPDAAPPVTGVRVAEFNGLVDRSKGSEDFEGESDDEALRSPEQPRVVRLVPRAGPYVTVMAMADLHRHQGDYFVLDPERTGRRLTLPQYFSERLAPEVDILAFAGDLGLEQNEELRSGGCRGVDRRAAGVRVSARKKDEETLLAWRELLGQLLAARSEMHVVLVGGNHDGLLCHDDECLNCKRLRRCKPSWARLRKEDRWGHSPSFAANAAVSMLTDGLPPDRVHCLRDEAVVLSLSGGRRVRVVGSPWTTRPKLSARSGCAHCCRVPPEADLLEAKPFWERHWSLIDGLVTEEPRLPCVLVTHAPPKGVLDRASSHLVDNMDNDHRVGDRLLLEMVTRASTQMPLLHVFGHIHARQWLFPEPECALRSESSSSLRPNPVTKAKRPKPMRPNLSHARSLAIGLLVIGPLEHAHGPLLAIRL